MAGLPIDHPCVITCCIIGSVFSAILYLTPLLMFYRLVQLGGRNIIIEELSPVPFILSLFTCTLKIYFAFTNGSGYILLLIISIIGLFFNCIYITIYLIYSPKKVKMYTSVLIMILDVGLSSLILLLTPLLWKGEECINVLGWIYLICLSITAVISPSSTILIKTRSNKCMPFYDLLLSTLASASWLIYGILIKNIHILVPNALSLMFSVIQTVIYIVYYNKLTDIKDGLPEKDSLPEEIITEAGVVGIEMIPAKSIA